MIKNLIYYFINTPKLTWSLFIGGLILGVLGLTSLRRELRPPVDFAVVTLTTSQPGADSLEVEENITNPLEKELKNIPSIRKSFSSSFPGVSQITLFLNLKNTQNTVHKIHRAVQNAVLPAHLPNPPKVHHKKAGEIPIMKLAVMALKKPMPHLKPDYRQAAGELKSLLENLPAIARITLTNEREREVHIALNPYQMHSKSIDLQEVVRAVKSHQDVSAGLMKAFDQNTLVRVEGRIQSMEDLKNTVVRSNFSGRQVFLKDIAQIKNTYEESPKRVIVNSQPAVILNIVKKENTDSIHTIEQIKKRLAEYKPPSHIKIHTLFDESKTTQKRLRIVTNNAWAGLGLVLLTLFIFLPFGSAAASCLSLPFCVLTTTALLAVMGITFNLITMCAFIISIGMLVDNGIVISENYTVLRLKNPPALSAWMSAGEMMKPIGASVLTTVLAFLPMLAAQGIMGQFIKWIPIVVCTALAMSLIEAFFLLPGRLRWTIPSPAPSPARPKQNKIKNQFEQAMRTIIQHKYLTSLIFLALLFFSFSLGLNRHRFVLFPKDRASSYTANFSMPRGVSLPKLETAALHLDQKIRKRIGKSLIDHTEINLNETKSSGSLILEIKKEREQTKNPKLILKKLRKIPKGDLKSLRFNAKTGGPHVGKAVRLIVYTENLQAGFFKEIKTGLKSIQGLLNIRDNKEYSGPEYFVHPHNTALSRMGLSAGAVGSALQTALTGSLAGEITQNGDKIPIRIQYNNLGRSRLDLLQKITIPAGPGLFVPLSQITQWEKRPQGLMVKKHYNFKPALDFYADIDQTKTTSRQANMHIQKIMQNIKQKHPSLSYHLAGEHETLNESLRSLLKAMIFTAFAVLAVLLMMFNSFLVSFLILSNVLFGWIGISWAFLLHSKPLSFFALIGAVGLSGVVINSSIILISCIENLKQKHKDKPLEDILAEAAAMRLRPIVMTTATTALGLLPTAYGLGGYDSILVPMTLALSWGLVSGTGLSLIWTPCGYAIISEWAGKITRKIYKKSL